MSGINDICKNIDIISDGKGIKDDKKVNAILNEIKALFVASPEEVVKGLDKISNRGTGIFERVSNKEEQMDFYNRGI